jgi:hypothetical protein
MDPRNGSVFAGPDHLALAKVAPLNAITAAVTMHHLIVFDM